MLKLRLRWRNAIAHQDFGDAAAPDLGDGRTASRRFEMAAAEAELEQPAAK